MNNRGQGAKKDILAEWVSLGLRKALTATNIKSGFKTTSIYPLNPNACDKHFGPSEGFSQGPFIEAVDSESSSDDESNHDDLLQDMQDSGLQSREVVVADQGDEDLDVDEGLEAGLDLDPEWEGADPRHQGDCTSSQEHPESLIDQHLSLPAIAAPAAQRRRLQPIIDYSRSIRLTDPEHLQQLKALRDRRQEAAKALEDRKLENHRRKNERAAAKQAKANLQKEKSDERETNKRLGIYWENVKNSGWGNKLEEFLKSGAPIPADAYHAPYCGTVPQICIYNQRVAKMRLELKKKNQSGRLVVPTTPVPWARSSYSSHPPVK
jgi:hypothetical protein